MKRILIPILIIAALFLCLLVYIAIRSYLTPLHYEYRTPNDVNVLLNKDIAIEYAERAMLDSGFDKIEFAITGTQKNTEQSWYVFFELDKEYNKTVVVESADEFIQATVFNNL